MCRPEVTYSAVPQEPSTLLYADRISLGPRSKLQASACSQFSWGYMVLLWGWDYKCVQARLAFSVDAGDYSDPNELTSAPPPPHFSGPPMHFFFFKTVSHAFQAGLKLAISDPAFTS